MIKMVRDHAIRMEEWQQINGCKLPDYDPSHVDNTPDFIRRIIWEREDLAARLDKLTAFINSPKFQTVSDIQVDLLQNNIISCFLI